MYDTTFGIWRLNSHVVLPLVFDDALSYLEQVGMLIDRINALQKDIISLEEKIKDISQEEEIQELINQISILTQEQNEIINQLNILKSQVGELSGLEDSIQENTIEIERLKLQISNIWLEVSSYISEMTHRNNQLIMDIFENIEKIVTEQICTRNGMLILVQNPVQGIITSLNECLMDIRKTMVAVGGVTLVEYDSYNLTMEEYENLHLTMIQYDYSFRWVMLNKEIKIIKNNYRDIIKKIETFKREIENNTTGIDPTTYQKTTAFILAEKAITSFFWGCTIEQYERYNLTISQYEEKNIAAIKYDEEMLLIMLLEKIQELSIEWEYVDKEYGVLSLYGTYSGEDGIIIFPENLDYPIYAKAEAEYKYDINGRKLTILNYNTGKKIKIVLYYLRRIEKL